MSFAERRKTFWTAFLQPAPPHYSTELHYSTARRTSILISLETQSAPARRRAQLAPWRPDGQARRCGQHREASTSQALRKPRTSDHTKTFTSPHSFEPFLRLSGYDGKLAKTRSASAYIAVFLKAGTRQADTGCWAARPDRRSRHACGRLHCLLVLFNLDTVDGMPDYPSPHPSRKGLRADLLCAACTVALCRLGPPAAKLLSPARLGHSHPRHPHPSGLSRGGIVPECRHDPE
jgi:hypothetical protein